MKHLKTHFLTTAAAAVLICIGGGAAYAQRVDPAAVSSEVPDIVVTAQKRGEQKLKDVPISISVLGGADLDKATSNGVNALVANVPGVAIYGSYSGNGSKLAIRGVTASASLFAGSGTTAYYLDDIPFALVKIPLTPDASPYDLQQVEVLKGPQGTLYGASALSGVVRVITHNADLTKFEMKARGGVATTDGGAASYNLDAAVNVPIIEDKLAVRLVAGYDHTGGYVDRPLVSEKDYNATRNQSYRVKVAAKPADRLRVDFTAGWSRINGDGLNTSFANRTVPTKLPEPWRTNYDVQGLKLSYELDGATIESSSSHLKYFQDNLLDVSNIMELHTQLRARTYNQEIRAFSRGARNFNWSIGANYRDSEDQRIQQLPTFAADINEINKSKSVAAFGEVSQYFLDRKLQATAGLRYFHDDVSLLELSRSTGARTGLVDSSSTFQRVTPRFVLSWYPNRQMSFYASYSRGFRSGFQQSGDVIAVAPTIPAVKPDTLTNYEVGAKGLLGHLNYELAVYYQDWKDPQQRQFVPFGPGLTLATPINGSPARGLGVDLAISGQVVKGLTLGGTLSVNDLSYSGDVISNGVRVYKKGDRLDESPKMTASLNGSYHAQLGAGFSGRLSASMNYTSKMNSTNAGTGAFFAGDDITLVNSSIEIIAPSYWSVRVYADNITNENGAARPVSLPQQYYTYRPRPRTFGIQVDFKY